MLAVIPLMAGTLIFTAFDNVFPSFFSIIMASWVLTNSIDFSSWSCHGIHQEEGSIAYYNKLSYISTLANYQRAVFIQYLDISKVTIIEILLKISYCHLG